MAGGSNGYRAALVSRQLTPGLISSLRETAGFPPFISFSTSYPELDSSTYGNSSRISEPPLEEAGPLTTARWIRWANLTLRIRPSVRSPPIP
jgi:hypothetical protein